MRNKPTSAYTNEELISNEKKIKVLTIMLASSMIVLLATSFVLILKKGFNPVIIIPVSLLPLLIINIINLKNIKKEKEKRGLS